jgi:hypothetical protein
MSPPIVNEYNDEDVPVEAPKTFGKYLHSYVDPDGFVRVHFFQQSKAPKKIIAYIWSGARVGLRHARPLIDAALDTAAKKHRWTKASIEKRYDGSNFGAA